MAKRGRGKVDPILEAAFGWLYDLGFSGADDPHMTPGAAFSTDLVVVRPTYHWHDEYADVTIGRRWTPEPAPYWSHIHLGELLDHAGRGGRFDGHVRDEAILPDVFALAASLLRAVAADQLAGRHLEVLDDIIAARPHQGVPGLDFPVAEPWGASREGLWFTTDYAGPLVGLNEAMGATRSHDPTERATAALHLHPGIASRRDLRKAAFDRLVELLADTDIDVRRAAASTLSEWGRRSVLDPILHLLDAEEGDAASPFAAAATFLAIDGPSPVRDRVRDALDRFAIRGRPAAKQVTALRWRLDDHPRGYPLVVEVRPDEPD